MKKIIICLISVFVMISLTSCSKSTEYTNLDALDGNNEFSKLVVTNLEEISRQSDVTTIAPEVKIPGNGTLASTDFEKNFVTAANEEIYNYDYIDSKGMFYLDNISTSQKLYKYHSNSNGGADNQVETYLNDDTAVKKTMTLRNSIYPSSSTEELAPPVNMTGLYAPAGELIKVEISEELAALNPAVYIGATAVNGETNDISSSDTYSRLPNRVKKLILNDTINYIGSPLGGQIYIQVDLEEYSLTMTGAVEYFHYIHNLTSREELVRLYDSTAPMIDIEIPDLLRVNMPRNELQILENNIYNELTEDLNLDKESSTYRAKAKELVIDYIIETTESWKMYCELSSHVCPSDLYRSNNISVFYDSYVLTNNASTGNAYSTFNIEEGREFFDPSFDRTNLLEVYNYHFWNNSLFIEQGSSEVVSNVLTILSQMLYGTYGEGRTAINNNHDYSNAYSALVTAKTKTSGNDFNISKYVTLMHSFGAKTFIDAITMNVDEDILRDRLYLQFSYTTGLNMEYYFEEVLGYTISDTSKEKIKNQQYDMYLPIVSSIQIGQVVNNQKIYNTQNYGALSFEAININESICVPKDVEFEIVNISGNTGEVEQRSGMYFYNLNSESKDEFIVTVKAYNDEYTHTVNIIMGVSEQYSNQVISSATTTLYNNPDNIDLDNINYSDLEINKTIPLANTDLKYSVDTGYNGVFVTYAELYLPDTRTYTFNVCGLGDIKISMGDSLDTLEEVLRYKTLTQVSSFDATNADRTFTYDVVSYKKIVVKIEVSSVEYLTYERVEFLLGCNSTYTSTGITSISNNSWYGLHSSYEVGSPRYAAYNNDNNLELDDVNCYDLSIAEIAVLSNACIQYNITSGYFVIYAHIVLPEEKEYIFNVKGLGYTKISIGDSYNNLTEVVRHTQEGSTPSQCSAYDITDKSRTFVVDGSVTKSFILKMEVANTGRAECYIGYVENGNVVDLPASMWYGHYSSKDEITPEYTPYNTESFFKIDKSITTSTRIDDDVTVIYQTCNLDEKFLTIPNSSVQNIDSGSTFIYRYSQEVTANYFALQSGENTISYFEIYISNNGMNWTQAFKGICDYEHYTCLELDDYFTFQYVKLVFTESYTGNTIDIANFEFQLRCEALTVIDLPNNNLKYFGNASVVENLCNLNGNIIEFDNTISFEFTGSSLLIYGNLGSNYGVVEITINDYTYQVDLNSSKTTHSTTLLALSNLEHNTYTVTMKAVNGLGNVDFIAAG